MPKNWSVKTLYKRLLEYIEENSIAPDASVEDLLADMGEDVINHALGR